MIVFVSAGLSLLSFRLRCRASLELEVFALRHQLGVLRRQCPHRLRLRCSARLFWVWLYRLWPRSLEAMILVKPATVIHWHRRGFRLYRLWRSSLGQRGRPPVGHDVQTLIRQMSQASPLWGAPRIHGELLKLGIRIGQTAVAKYMIKRSKSPSPTWRSFLRNHVDGIAALDMFVVVSGAFSLLYVVIVYVVIVLGHARRQILHVAVTQHLTQDWFSRQITEAFPWNTAPRYLLRDRDVSYGPSFRRPLQAMGIDDVVTAPRSPWQSPYAERVIGSIRRECLDHIIVLNERHLRRVLSSYVDDYHRSRTHLALDKDCPHERPIQPPSADKVIVFPKVGGLHHHYERLAA